MEDTQPAAGLRLGSASQLQLQGGRTSCLRAPGYHAVLSSLSVMNSNLSKGSGGWAVNVGHLEVAACPRTMWQKSGRGFPKSFSGPQRRGLQARLASHIHGVWFSYWAQHCAQMYRHWAPIGLQWTPPLCLGMRLSSMPCD
jgi:hypothetical protein